MDVMVWAALILGAGLITSGARAIRQRRASVPERWEGSAAIFDIRPLKTVFSPRPPTDRPV
jgi:hypothetical protein